MFTNPSMDRPQTNKNEKNVQGTGSLQLTSPPPILPYCTLSIDQPLCTVDTVVHDGSGPHQRLLGKARSVGPISHMKAAKSKRNLAQNNRPTASLWPQTSISALLSRSPAFWSTSHIWVLADSMISWADFLKRFVVCMCVCLHGFVCTMCARVRGSQKRELDPLIIESQGLWAVMWALGSEPGSSARTASALEPSFQAPEQFCFSGKPCLIELTMHSISKMGHQAGQTWAIPH